MHDGSGGHGDARRRDQLQGVGSAGSWKGRGWEKLWNRAFVWEPGAPGEPWSLPASQASEIPEVTPRGRRLLSSWAVRLICLGFLK